MDKRSLYFTSQGFRSQEIQIAPDISDFNSKRRTFIENEDKSLDLNLGELDLGTKARNRAFQDRLDEVWFSTEGWEAKLKTEAKEAVETILNLKDDYQKHLDNLAKSLHEEINLIYDKFDLEMVVKESGRVDTIEKDVDMFFRKVVPVTIEQQSGEVSRQLRRTYETFDIEKKKELKRETKLVTKASKHLQSTAQRFEDENSLLSSCFFTLEDDVVEHERHSARMHLMRNASAIDHTATLNAVSAAESHVRATEDVDVLDTVIETQSMLQQTVLMHFGTKTDDALNGDPPSVARLNRRMSRILAKAAAEAAAAEEAAAQAAADAAAAAALLEPPPVVEPVVVKKGAKKK